MDRELLDVDSSASSSCASRCRSDATAPSVGTWRTSFSSSRAAAVEEENGGLQSASPSANCRRTWPPGMRRFSSSEVPSATIRPWSRTAIRSASSSASSRYWVVRKIVTPPATRLTDAVPHRAPAARVQPGRWARRGRSPAASRPASSPGRGGGASRPSRSTPACGPRRSGRTARAVPVTRVASGRSAEMVQVGHQLHVLLAGQQLVHRRELAGDADRRPHRVRVVPDVVARHPHLARRRRGSGWRGSGSSSSCRRRSGPSSAKMVPSSTVRSTAVEDDRLIERLAHARARRRRVEEEPLIAPSLRCGPARAARLMRPAAARRASHSCSSIGICSTRKSANADISERTARRSSGASPSTSRPSRASSPSSWYSATSIPIDCGELMSMRTRSIRSPADRERCTTWIVSRTLTAPGDRAAAGQQGLGQLADRSAPADRRPPGSRAAGRPWAGRRSGGRRTGPCGRRT